MTKTAFFSFPVTSSDIDGGPCSFRPCLGGGSCEEHDGTFTCFCTSDRTGERCERQLTDQDVQVPSFDGFAFVEMKPIQKVEHKFSVEIEFKTQSQDGLILFAQQNTNGDGDFISLALVNG